MNFLLVIFLFAATHASTLRPTEFRDLAVERTHLLKTFMEGEHASEAMVKQSKLLPNPVFTLQSGRLKSGTQSGAVVDVTLNQPVPWPGKRAAHQRSQELLLKIAHTDLEEAKFMVAQKVLSLTFELATIQELEKHQAERKKRFSLVHRYLTSRPQASPKQMVDRDMIETQIKVFEKGINDLAARKEGIINELMVWTGDENPQILFDWKQVPVLPDIDRYLSALSGSLRVKRLESLKNLSESRVEEARLQARPDIIMGVNYRQENIAPTNHFYHAQVSVVMPIIDRGQHTEEAARAEVRKNEANKTWTEQELSAQIHSLYPNLHAAFKSMEIFSISEVHHLEQRFNRAEEAFRKGQIDVLTFMQTDTQVHEYLDLAYTSRFQYLTTLAELDALVGRKMEL